MTLQLVPCPSCGQKFHVKQELGGKAFRCRKCDALVTIPFCAEESAAAESSRTEPMTSQRPRPSFNRPSPSTVPPRENLGRKPIRKWTAIAGIACSVMLAAGLIPRLFLTSLQVRDWRLPESPASLPGEPYARYPLRIDFEPPLTGSDSHSDFPKQLADVGDASPSTPSPVPEAVSPPSPKPDPLEVVSDANPTPSRLPDSAKVANPTRWGSDDSVRCFSLQNSDGSQARPVFPGWPSSILQFGQSVVDITTSNRVAGLHPDFLHGRSVISPLGTRVARYTDFSGDKVAVVYVHSTATPNAKPVRLENSDGIWRIDAIAFLDEVRLIFHAQSEGFFVWDTVTGKLLTSFESKSPLGRGFAVSSDGRYIAVASGREVAVFDTVKGLKAAQMISEHDGRELDLFWCHGLEFSPDDAELAGLFTDGQFVVWSSTGDIVVDEMLSGLGEGTSSDQNLVHWLPDGQSWFLAGHKLLDRKSMITVWEVEGTPRRDGLNGVVNQQTVMTTREHEGRELLFLQIPWEQIHAGLKDVDLSEKPLLARGGTISVDCRVTETRFADVAQTKAAILEAVGKRLATKQITIGDNPDVTLVINYDEKAGREIRVSSIFGLIGGNSDAVNVEDTEVTLNAEMRVTGRPEPFWQNSISLKTDIIVDAEEMTPKGFRDEHFKEILERIERLGIPARIAGSNAAGFPLKTSVPESALYANTFAILDRCEDISDTYIADAAPGSDVPQPNGSPEPAQQPHPTATPQSTQEKEQNDEPVVPPKYAAVPVDWQSVPVSARIPIPLEIAETAQPAFSSMRPNFVCYKRALFDVNTGKRIADLPAEFISSRVLVSPDGRTFARIEGQNSSQIKDVFLHSMDNLKESIRISTSRYQHVHWVQFLNQQMLIIYARTPESGEWTIWDTASGKLIRTIVGLGPDSYESVACVSPSGTLVAAACEDDRIRIFDMENGGVRAAVHLERKLGKYSVPIEFLALQFSPDSQELVAFGPFGKLGVWTTDGTLLHEESIPELLPRSFDKPVSLSWLADSSGWLVGNNMIIDRQSMSVVWVGDSRPGERCDEPMSCVLNQDQILVTVGDDEGRELVPMKIPWDKISGPLEALRKSSTISLKPGSNVSLKVTLGDIRLSESQSVSTAVRDAITDRIQSCGLSVVENQPVQLMVKYSEVAVNDRAVAGGLLGILLPREEKKSNVKDTKATLILELQDSTSGQIYWQETIEHTGGFLVDGEVTEQSLRDSAFKLTLQRLILTELPTQLHSEKSKVLPIHSFLP